MGLFALCFGRGGVPLHDARIARAADDCAWKADGKEVRTG